METKSAVSADFGGSEVKSLEYDEPGERERERDMVVGGEREIVRKARSENMGRY